MPLVQRTGAAIGGVHIACLEELFTWCCQKRFGVPHPCLCLVFGGRRGVFGVRLPKLKKQRFFTLSNLIHRKSIVLTHAKSSVLTLTKKKHCPHF